MSLIQLWKFRIWEKRLFKMPHFETPHFQMVTVVSGQSISGHTVPFGQKLPFPDSGSRVM